jgi:hypothetical protein
MVNNFRDPDHALFTGPDFPVGELTHTPQPLPAMPSAGKPAGRGMRLIK